MTEKKDKELIRSTNKEVLAVIVLYALFFAWWYFSAYSFGNDPAEYKYIFGFPEWFFYSCIASYIVVSFVLWGVVHFMFRDIPLDREDEKDEH